jgi:hypothetical protein
MSIEHHEHNILTCDGCGATMAGREDESSNLLRRRASLDGWRKGVILRGQPIRDSCHACALEALHEGFDPAPGYPSRTQRQERRAALRAARAAGATLETLARQYGLTRQRVHQILRQRDEESA